MLKRIGQILHPYRYRGINQTVKPSNDVQPFRARAIAICLNRCVFELDIELDILHHQQSLTIARKIGNRHVEGNALGSLGNAYYSLGQYEQAIATLQQHLTIAKEIGDRREEGAVMYNLGATQLKLKQYPEALENSFAALAIFREIGDRTDEVEALKKLAELHQKLGESDVARGYCEQALALATELGIPLKAECETLMAELESGRIASEEE